MKNTYHKNLQEKVYWSRKLDLMALSHLVQNHRPACITTAQRHYESFLLSQINNQWKQLSLVVQIRLLPDRKWNDKPNSTVYSDGMTIIQKVFLVYYN